MTLSLKRFVPALALVVVALMVLVISRIPNLELPLRQYVPAVESYSDNQRPLQALYRLEIEAGDSEGWTPERAERAGRIWWELGSPENAVSFWQIAGHAPAIRRALAEAYIELGEWALASDALTSLSDPDSDAWVSMQLGLIYLVSNHEQARMLLESAIAAEPGYADSLSGLIDTLAVTSNPTRIGMILSRAGLWNHAEHVFADAPFDPVALSFVALARDTQGKDGSAYLDAALELGNGDPQVHYIAGLYYRQGGDLEASLDSFVQAVALHPDDPALYAELGTAYLLMGDLVTAEHWLEFALNLSGNDPRYAARIAALRTEEQDLQNALALMMDQAEAGGGDPTP